MQDLVSLHHFSSCSALLAADIFQAGEISLFSPIFAFSSSACWLNWDWLSGMVSRGRESQGTPSLPLLHPSHTNPCTNSLCWLFAHLQHIQAWINPCFLHKLTIYSHTKVLLTAETEISEAWASPSQPGKIHPGSPQLHTTDIPCLQQAQSFSLTEISLFPQNSHTFP